MRRLDALDRFNRAHLFDFVRLIRRPQRRSLGIRQSDDGEGRGGGFRSVKRSAAVSSPIERQGQWKQVQGLLDEIPSATSLREQKSPVIRGGGSLSLTFSSLREGLCSDRSARSQRRDRPGG